MHLLENLFEKNQLNISLSQPNRVEQGDMTFRFMGLADKNGILPYEDHKVSLSPSGRQKDLTISYYTNHLNNFKIGIKAILTDDLGHVKNSNLSTNLLISTSLVTAVTAPVNKTPGTLGVDKLSKSTLVINSFGESMKAIPPVPSPLIFVLHPSSEVILTFPPTNINEALLDSSIREQS